MYENTEGGYERTGRKWTGVRIMAIEYEEWAGERREMGSNDSRVKVDRTWVSV